MEENPPAAGHHRSVEVYFDDLDAFGMVHNARYAVLQERAGSGSGWSTGTTSGRPTGVR